MKKMNRSIAVFLAGFLALAIFLTGCTQAPPTVNGNLSGHISIGPLCPVEHSPPDPNCQPTPATFKAYALSVFDTQKIKRKTIIGDATQNGAYSVELPPGTYEIRLETGSRPFSQTISIVANQTTTLDIFLDTGIR
jgi:hypothetical protein